MKWVWSRLLAIVKWYGLIAIVKWSRLLAIVKWSRLLPIKDHCENLHTTVLMQRNMTKLSNIYVTKFGLVMQRLFAPPAPNEAFNALM